MTMCVKERVDVRPWSAALVANIARVTGLWNESRRRHGSGGDFLCGRFSIADAFYAPVAFRFRTYGVAPEGAAGDYLRNLLAHPWLREWEADALVETTIATRSPPLADELDISPSPQPSPANGRGGAMNGVARIRCDPDATFPRRAQVGEGVQ